jgi:hypothetical protein
VIKISKDAARYTPIAKMDEHCRDCRHFEVLAPKHCEAVEGIIQPGGWCKLFSRKHKLAEAARHG